MKQTLPPHVTGKTIKRKAKAEPTKQQNEEQEQQFDRQEEHYSDYNSSRTMLLDFALQRAKDVQSLLFSVRYAVSTDEKDEALDALDACERELRNVVLHITTAKRL